MAFQLDPQLQADTLAVIDIDLCDVRLMNDRRYPWLILVPRLCDLVELTDLSHGDRYRLMDNIAACSAVLQSTFPETHKINVATLGNMVRQLHVHVIARRTSDAAWPGPVWGVGTAQSYSKVQQNTLLATLRDGFDGDANGA